MAADLLVDRAHVEAGAAADAGERLAGDLLGEHLGATVVEQHDVQRLGPFVLGAQLGPVSSDW